ncbi:hypothetical protein WJX72_002414 [[Myrmecia] bisecta]|uniref:Cytochrome P450 n=1 Tax=[Myrmecia] bisecta TaxID=41462 RepID=A0AAW1R5E4_9CHLO
MQAGFEHAGHSVGAWTAQKPHLVGASLAAFAAAVLPGLTTRSSASTAFGQRKAFEAFNKSSVQIRRRNSVHVRAMAPTTSTKPSTPAQLTGPIEEPPSAGRLGLGFLLNGPKFTKEALQKYGHVWKLSILGLSTVYGIGGNEGLRLFYDERNVKRFPAASSTLKAAAWQLNESFAIPPLDGDQWRRRKLHMMATATSKEQAQAYLQALDGAFVDAIASLGKDGQEFSMWDALNRAVLGGLSGQILGYSLQDYAASSGQSMDKLVAAIRENFTVFGTSPIATKQTAAFKLLLEYLRVALAKTRADPAAYAGTGLSNYLASPEAQRLMDDEILLDMHQMLAVGAYGICTQGAALLFSLAKNPQVRKRIAEEGAPLATETASFGNLRALPYTFAVVKEALRYWPAVHVVAGQTQREIIHENKRIPAQASILALLYGTTHDARVFKNPEMFDPERFLPPRNEGPDETWEGWMVAFGAGDSSQGHACAGKHVAISFLLLIALRFSQGWAWQLTDADERMLDDRIGPVPSKGLTMRRNP